MEVTFVLESNHLVELLTGLQNTLAGFGPFTDATNPLASPWKTTAVKVTPQDGDRAKVTVTLPQQLELEFRCSLEVPPPKMDKANGTPS